MANFKTPTNEELNELYLTEVDQLDQHTSGFLWSWGTGTNGALGHNAITHRSSPIQTIAGGSDWKQISAGGDFVAAIKSNNSLWLWGHNHGGALGQNNLTHRSSPVQVLGAATNWKQVATGHAHTAAIKTDGTLWTWGFNSSGQLGTNNLTHRSSPVQTIAVGTNWSQVSCGQNHTAAIKTDGTLWTWGLNASGQLGTNNTTNRSSPVQTIAGGNNWKLVVCGNDFTAAIKTDGTLWTWGLNTSGQLGDNTVVTKSSPVQVLGASNKWRSIGTTRESMLAIKTDGTLWTWGHGSYGELGDGTVIGKSSPVQIGSSREWGKCISSTASVTTGAIKNDGTFWVWGYNNGRVGDNTVIHRSSPVQTALGGNNWKSVAFGRDFGLGITISES
jgi:alpha-tubulin suppressor-like RCC1 family protein